MNSILIITYGRNKELIDTLQCINKYQGERIELLVLDNNKTNSLKNDIYNCIKNKSIYLSYYHTGENMGVAKGRNFLISKACGEILITLDDDVEVFDITELERKVNLYFMENIKLGAIAFNIINFYSKMQLRHEQPHGNKRKVDFTKNFYTYYFIGAGHAIKREAYDKVGVYPLDLGLYGGEERDLSFRILECGYDILYASDIVVYHKVSPNGRMSRKDEDFYRYRNQLIVLNRYMPFIYRVSSNIIWSIFYLIRKKGTFKEIFYVFRDIIILKKQIISKECLKKMKEVKARLWY